MKAVILSTGDELVLGQAVDTNSAWLSAQLASRGVMTVYHKTVGDDLHAVVNCLREASGAADLVVLTGGLGPTKDDLTREALAILLDAPLELHKPSLEHIARFFAKLGRPAPSTNEVQAMCPRGAKMLDNEWGTAPGIEVRVGSARVFAFPGVPYEMRQMFERYVLPVVAGQTGRVILTEAVVTFGAGESLVAEKLGDLMRRDRNPLVGTTASSAMVTVRIRSDFPSAAEAQRALAATAGEVRGRLGELVVGTGGVTLQSVVGELLGERGLTLATAESCTGGLVAKMITDIPGSSAWFKGGWISYSNELKQSELGVPAELMGKHGAVSEPVALAMAEGAMARSRADCALSLTGIAGPDGGTAEKPVGTVWIGLARRTAAGPSAAAQLFRFPGDREMVRERAARAAMNVLRLALIQGR